MKSEQIRCLSVSEELRVRQHLYFEGLGDQDRTQFLYLSGTSPALQYLGIIVALGGLVAYRKTLKP
jgi:hypothetical protein